MLSNFFKEVRVLPTEDVLPVLRAVIIALDGVFRQSKMRLDLSTTGSAKRTALSDPHLKARIEDAKHITVLVPCPVTEIVPNQNFSVREVDEIVIAFTIDPTVVHILLYNVDRPILRQVIARASLDCRRCSPKLTRAFSVILLLYRRCC